jgi:hypothetical protein
VVIFAALALAALFGAGDQYLGSFSAHPWMAEISLLSAPWLVLPFVAGLTQRDPRRASALGLACTAAALVGYGVMTLSPIEHAHGSLLGFVRSESRVLIGGIVTGPLFGWFGQQWRVRRAWLGALGTAAALCLEPLVRLAAGWQYEIKSAAVAAGEIAAGLVLATMLALARVGRAAARQPPAA